MTSHDHRFLCLRKQLCRLSEQIVSGSLCTFCESLHILFRSDVIRWAIDGLLELHILRDIDQHRTRTTTQGNTESLVYHISNLTGVAHQEIMLGNWLSNTDYISLLKGITANECARHLPRNSHKRR